VDVARFDPEADTEKWTDCFGIAADGGGSLEEAIPAVGLFIKEGRSCR